MTVTLTETAGAESSLNPEVEEMRGGRQDCKKE